MYHVAYLLFDLLHLSHAVWPKSSSLLEPRWCSSSQRLRQLPVQQPQRCSILTSLLSKPSPWHRLVPGLSCSSLQQELHGGL